MSYAGALGKRRMWDVKCTCGTDCVVSSSSLKNGGTKSCGCLQKDSSKAKIIDITGRVFGRLTILSKVERPLEVKSTSTYWLTTCLCGVVSVKSYSSLIRGHTKSCGCLAVETSKVTNTKHGVFIGKNAGDTSIDITYKSWKAMRYRCISPKSKSYDRYGGRGIKICEEWSDYSKFLEDMGNRPSITHSIDRINNDGDYCPENCRWATPKEQYGNKTYRTKGVTVKIDGVLYPSIAAASRTLGHCQKTIISRNELKNETIN